MHDARTAPALASSFNISPIRVELANGRRTEALTLRNGDDAPVVVHFSRDFGRIKWQDAFMTLLDTLAIFYRMKLLRYYDRVAETTLLSELRVNPRSREVSHRSAAETLLVPQPSAAIGQ